MEARTSTPIRARRHFRLDTRLRGGRRYVRGAIKVTRLAECRQRAARRIGVASKLREEGVGSGKAHGVAKPYDERNVDAVTIEISLGIEEVRLDATSLVAERRTSAEVHHTIETPARSLDLHGVHAVGGKQLSRVGNVHVECRVSEQPAPCIASNHSPIHGILPAQKLTRSV